MRDFQIFVVCLVKKKNVVKKREASKFDAIAKQTQPKSLK